MTLLGSPPTPLWSTPGTLGSDSPVQQVSFLPIAQRRLSEGGLKYERYRAEVAERKASMDQELTAAAKTGGVSPEFLEFMERELKLL